MVFSVLHGPGVDQRDLMCSWDAAGITGMDAGRSRPPSHQVLNGTDYRKAFHELTGGSLKPHIAIGWGTVGDLVQQRMHRGKWHRLPVLFTIPVHLQLGASRRPDAVLCVAFAPEVTRSRFTSDHRPEFPQ